jgi:hypothetical protein
METGKASCPLVHDGQSPIRQKKTEKSERFWKEAVTPSVLPCVTLH